MVEHAPSTTSGPTLRREVIPPHPQSSVRVLTHDFPSEICGWGYHPEYEIHLITKTRGSFIAGDHIGTFAPGHVSLMGPNLPHDWVSDLAEGQVAVDRDAVIQFSDEWIRRAMEHLPELAEVSEMLNRSTRGLVFSGATAWRAAEAILACVHSVGVERLGHLFKILALFAHAPTDEYEVVASEWLGRATDATARDAGGAGLSYIFENLTGDIRLSTAARLAYMSEPTFSKYFKAATGTTFSSMVKKLRIAYARRLLDTTEHSVSQVAAMSGYHNIANFNRQFLAEVGTTPTAYRRLESAQKPPPEVFSLGLRAPSD
ncbi:AraC family transcriptional regulator [Intrasporangium calvum]|uniref:Transcriptional regulator, AraC family n=1 Tax=Intrasporangium calvum (strain ATCC 23552 / DSM 43043 / JCM 3097 / NBRC 12989 / NCIMB 10167 / NRRL B-3866 / 7 KIP) TaxID=710696 RepID=E6SD19_INTC7|nr:AraC family transcriptional regulator [Intrasporangium calvum]ADU48607.1 transcriptional regulator, AraC family [Intrasporangium calvum DSM 43043]